MHWSPEHAQSLNQWPEQHLDVSSTTSSPAHKPDLYPSGRQRFNYAWANDDISALTASNLLKRYAEKYAGVLDSPYERPGLSGYGDGAFGPVNGQKGEAEPWADGAYALTPLHDGLAKGVVPNAAAANLSSEPVYAGSSCGAAAGLGSPQEYASGYGGAYLPSGYCGQAAAALPAAHPPPGLLPPAHPPSALVPPAYGSAGPAYGYAAGPYPPQPAYGGLHPPHPSASYLPSAIAAPTPIAAAPPPAPRPPPAAAAYGYQSPGLAPPPPSLSGEAGGALKRKAFEMAAGPEEGGGDGRYGKYGGYEPAKSTPASPYPLADGGECRGNGFGGSAEPPVPFKAGKRPAAAEERGGEYGSQPAKGLASPRYGAGEAAARPAEPFERFSPPLANGERAGEPAHHPFAPRRRPKPPNEPPKSVDPLVLELVNSKMVDGGPPVQWTDIAGQVSVKAAIEEELVWPVLRPGAYTAASRPPRTILLFGPRGTGKTLLSRCISTQLGSTLLKLSGAALLSKWKAEAEKILQTVFFVASCRQPSVVLITEVEALLLARAGEDGGQASNLKSQLLSYLDNVATSTEQNVVVVGTTSRPGNMDEASHRRFAKRFYVSPPDSIARRQILHHTLAQQNYCLSEREMASLVQRTESYSGSELIQLCQQAGAATLHALPGPLQPTSYKDFESAFCKVRPGASQKELDLFAEWDKMYGSRH
ncbi:fidgetin-like protein 2 [Struthio camelus]|uniref:fidgetin-like protein 2 n=1 Tax=Struthio camelus TaxID=8801 RepID=UPI003603E71F